MPKLGDVVEKVRSKNAGPFWLTIDIFCGDHGTFEKVKDALQSADVAAIYRVRQQELKRFDIADLNVIKFSMPRPVVQGHIHDRDMHGAGYAALLAELEI